jgi:hypothetical protein
MDWRDKENWVGWASGACAVHCLAHPLVVVLPVAALGERLEGAVLVALVVLAALLLWSGARRHGRLAPALPVLAAIALWSAALAGAVEEPVKALVIAGGGGLSFWGLTWSRSLVRACPPGHGHAAAVQHSPADQRADLHDGHTTGENQSRFIAAARRN